MCGSRAVLSSRTGRPFLAAREARGPDTGAILDPERRTVLSFVATAFSAGEALVSKRLRAWR